MLRRANPSKLIVYELLALFRPIPKNELKPILKRTASAIFERGGVIRKLENLGTRNTPYKISKHGCVYRQASYFLYEFHIPNSNLDSLKDELGRDVDIVRPRIFIQHDLCDFQCTLDEELLPAPYRKDVQELIELAKKKKKRPTFEYNTGLDYYPFQI